MASAPLPSFSVVIPAYRAAGCVAQAIGSALAQTYPPLEVLVVDDASPDSGATLRAIEAFAPPVRLLRLTGNVGPSGARNAGWAAAQADYVAFLDADDVWHPEKLHRVAQVLVAHPHIQFLGHPFVDGPFPPAAVLERARVRRLPFWRILLKNPYPAPGIVVRRTLPLRFDVRYRHTQDHELALRAASRGACYYLPAPLVQLGRPQGAPGGVSGNHWGMRRDELRLYRNVGRYRRAWHVAVPLLLVYSLAKHVYKGALRRLGRRHKPTA